MSTSLTCDNCGTNLVLDHASGRSAESGEDSAWVQIGTRAGTGWDACTISCASELLAGAVTERVNAELEVVMDVARTIREEKERDGGSGDWGSS